MDKAFKSVISSLEKTVRKLNMGRSVGPFRKLKVRVLGQQALLIRREVLGNLILVATNDFDALLNGEPPLEDIFKGLLREVGLIYDEKSEYIWLPDETKYEVIYKSEFILIDSPLPIYLIVSKALKAPEKNRQLVVSAIAEFGEELLELMNKYKVDMSNFI